MQDGGVLTGLRVLEIGHYVAAPFATRLLADLGADVVKVEPPDGDPVRGWGEQVDGQSLWWSMHARNKRSIALDLKSPDGRETVKALAARSDVLVENLRPGQLERLGLGLAALRERNAGLIVARISGYGQDGPGRDRAAFGVIGEAVGGLRHLTNQPPGESDLPPVRCGVSIGDSIAGLYAALGVVAALWRRDRVGGDPNGRTVDVALSEAVLSLMEGLLPEYGALGRVRQPAGAGIPTAAPTGAYPTADGEWMLIAANSDRLFARLAQAMGEPALAADPRFVDNVARCASRGEIDARIGAWSRSLSARALSDVLTEADVPHSKAYTAADIAADAQFRARGMVCEIDDPIVGRLLHAGVVPNIREEPGAIRWTGPRIDQHGDEIRAELAALDRATGIPAA